MRNIIIDCDPGHDDAIAILMALGNKDKLTIKGITTIGGNNTLDKITDNTLRILTLLEENIPVAKGEEGPLMRVLETAPDAHGESGMDGHTLPDAIYKPIDKHAVEFMAEIIENSKEKTTLVPLGPLTNIAILVKAYPHLKKKIECISLMGGGVYEGNITPFAEFNIYVDPEAAKIVFNSGIPIIMSGLDVTHKAEIMDDEIAELRKGGRASKFVGELLDFYAAASKRFGFIGSPMHDPCAIAYLLKPEIFKGEMRHVDIEVRGELTRGMTVADMRRTAKGNENALVLMDVDRIEFVKLMMDALKVIDNKQ